LGFTRIAKNPSTNPKHQAGMPFKQSPQGGLVAGLNARDQCLVIRASGSEVAGVGVRLCRRPYWEEPI
jgi:hypothetical protein